MGVVRCLVMLCECCVGVRCRFVCEKCKILGSVVSQVWVGCGLACGVLRVKM